MLSRKQTKMMMMVVPMLILLLLIPHFLPLTFFAAFDGDLLVGFCTWPLGVTGCLDTEPFSLFLLGEDGTEAGGGEGEGWGDEEEAGPVPRTAISSVAVRRRLRRLSCVSWSTTSNLVSLSTALIR